MQTPAYAQWLFTIFSAKLVYFTIKRVESWRRLSPIILFVPDVAFYFFKYSTFFQTLIFFIIFSPTKISPASIERFSIINFSRPPVASSSSVSTVFSNRGTVIKAVRSPAYTLTNTTIVKSQAAMAKRIEERVSYRVKVPSKFNLKIISNRKTIFGKINTLGSYAT